MFDCILLGALIVIVLYWIHNWVEMNEWRDLNWHYTDGQIGDSANDRGNERVSLKKISFAIIEKFIQMHKVNQSIERTKTLLYYTVLQFLNSTMLVVPTIFRATLYRLFKFIQLFPSPN